MNQGKEFLIPTSLFLAELEGSNRLTYRTVPLKINKLFHLRRAGNVDSLCVRPPMRFVSRSGVCVSSFGFVVVVRVIKKSAGFYILWISFTTPKYRVSRCRIRFPWREMIFEQVELE